MDTRKQFEAQWAPRGLGLSRSIEPGRAHEYESPYAQSAWKAWQLAIAYEREACAALCKQLADCDENTEAYRNGAAWCEERIMARSN